MSGMSRRRRRPPVIRKPDLTIPQVLGWIDAYKARWGRWPTADSGRIDGPPDETWSGVDAALQRGHRGLSGGSSLARLLVEQRGHRDRNHLPELKVNTVLSWADAHKRRTGEWPTPDSGPIPEAPGETWNAIALALARGKRGIKKRSTLAQLLARRRGRDNRMGRPLLTPARILTLAEAHHLLYCEWPTHKSGPVGTTGDTWRALDKALRNGSRGLPGGSSLFRLLKDHGKFGGKVTPFKKKPKPIAR
jgi:hypothetical protein